MIIWYRNSILASIVSIFGCAIALGGIGILTQGDTIPGIIMILIGAAVAWLGSKISDRKEEKKREKRIEIEKAKAKESEQAIEPVKAKAIESEKKIEEKQNFWAKPDSHSM